jgi:translocation and assembly module TamB
LSADPENPEAAPPPARRRSARLARTIARRGLLALAVLLAALIGAGVAVRFGARTEAGRALIVRLVDGRSLGDIGRLHVEGLSGDVFDTFGVRRVQIVDAHGPWLDLHDAVMMWDPVELLGRRVHARRLSVRLVQALRPPPAGKASAPPPSRPPVSLILDDVRLRLETAPAVSVERGLWDVAAKIDVRRSGRIRSRLSAKSVLHAGDGASILLQVGRGQRFVLQADAVEAKGGALAGALGLSADQPLRIHAEGGGGSDRGGARIVAASGASKPLEGSAVWGPSGLTADLRIALDASRLTRFLADRLGREARVKIAAAPIPQSSRNRGDLYRLDGRIDADNGALIASGPIDAKRRVAAGLKIDLSVRDLSKWLSWPKLGALHATGVLTGAPDRFDYKGGAEARGLDQDGYALARLAGPVEASLADGVWRLQGDLHGAGGGGKGLAAALLGPAPQVKADISRLKTGRLLIHALDVTGSGFKLAAAGDQGLLGRLSLKGRLAVANAGVLRPGAHGALEASFTAGGDADARAWTFAFDASGARFSSGLADLDHFLGASPRLSAKGVYGGGVLTVSSAKLDGAALNAEGQGRLDDKARIDADFTWTAKGPIEAGPVEIAGAAKGKGKITGAVSAPRADLSAELARLDLGPLEIAPAKLSLAVLSGPDGATGVLQVSGPTASSGPASAKAAFRLAADGIDLSDIVADAGGVKIDGALSLRSGEPSAADLTVVAGPGALLTAGRLNGALKIAGRPESAEVHLALSGQGLSAPGAPTTLHALSLSADGPLSRLPFKIAADSVDPVPWRFAGDGVFRRVGKGGEVTLKGGGRLKRSDFRLLEPADLRFGGEDRGARFKLALAGGQAEADIDQKGDQLDAKLAFAGVGLGAFQEDFTGQVSGTVDLHGRGARLEGQANATLVGARSRDEPPAEGLSAVLKATLSGGRLRLEGSAENAEGLKSKGAVDLPAEASAAPFRIAVDRTKPLSGSFSADGEIHPLWDLLAGGDRTLSGRVSASGGVAGTLNAPLATGQAALSGGRFRDVVTGLAIQGLQVDAAFGDDALTVRRFAGTDARGGAIAGEGRVSLTEGGDSTFTLDLKKFQLFDNDLGHASASGAVTVTHPAKGQGKLSGALVIDRADITATPPAPTGVVPMDVVEIHQETQPGQAPPAARAIGPPILLDVSIKAARGVYVKGKGLNVELSLDAHVGGSVARPALTGVAKVVGGSYDFAGKRFDVDSAGTVRLGDALDQIRLNLSATWADPTLTAIVKVRGTAAKPEITLTSTPVLPQDEVLARVLFGVSASQLSAAQGAEMASALASLGGGGGFDVIGNVRQFAGLDRLALGGTQATGTTISGGKYVTKDVYLELTGGGRNGSAAEIEWRIRHDLSLVSRYGAALDTRYTGDMDASVSVRFRKDF